MRTTFFSGLSCLLIACAQVTVGDRSDDGGADASALSDAAMRPAHAWVGVIGTGQSLAVGTGAGRMLHTAPRYHNLKLVDSGSDVLYDGVGDRLSLVPLVEPIRPYLPGPGYPSEIHYPNNIKGETPHTVMADEVTARVRASLGEDYVTIHSVVGEGARASRASSGTERGVPSPRRSTRPAPSRRSRAPRACPSPTAPWSSRTARRTRRASPTGPTSAASGRTTTASCALLPGSASPW